jgi:hypothetical protein
MTSVTWGGNLVGPTADFVRQKVLAFVFALFFCLFLGQQIRLASSFRLVEVEFKFNLVSREHEKVLDIYILEGQIIGVLLSLGGGIGREI